MAAFNTAPPPVGGNPQFQLLEGFLANPPKDTDLNTMYQTAAFVKGSDKVSFNAAAAGKVSQSTFRDQYSPEEKEKIYEVMNNFERAMANYEFKRGQLKIETPIRLGGGWLAGRVAGPQGKLVVKNLFRFFSTTPLNIQSLQYAKKGEEYAAEVLYRLHATPEEIKQFEDASIAEKPQILRALLLERIPGTREVPEVEQNNLVGFVARRWDSITKKWGSIKQFFSEKPQKSVVSKLSDQQLIHKTGEVITKVQEAPAKIEQTLAESSHDMSAIRDQYEAISEHLQHIDQNSSESLRITRFLVDVQYKHLTTAEKIEGIKRGIYPGKIGELDTLQLVQRWESIERKVQLYANLGLAAASVLSQLGVKIPKKFEKVVRAGLAAFQVIKGVSTSDPFAAIQGVGQLVGLFRSSGPDISAQRHEQITRMISHVFENQEVMIEMLNHLQLQVNQLFELNLEIAHAVNTIGRQILINHVEVMSKLQWIHEDILYIQSVVVQQEFEFLHDFSNLEAARRDYRCHNGVFETHQEAQTFFSNHIHVFNVALKRADVLFATSALHPSLHFKSIFNPADAAHISGSSAEFYENIWKNTLHYYQEFIVQEPDQETKKTMSLALFEPVTFFDDLLTLIAEKPEMIEQKLKAMFNFCKSQTNHLVLPSHILRTGRYVLDFYRYDALIKTHATGELFSLDELLHGQNVVGFNQRRGRRLLENILFYVNLSIAQQHLLAGGPLIPRVYEQFFDKFTVHAEIMGRPDGDHEKEALRVQMWNVVNLLGYNSMFASNAVHYALRTKLGLSNSDPSSGVKCLNYRMAYNHPSDPTALKALLPGWDLVPSPAEEGQPGWAVRCPFVDPKTQQELKLQLTHPSDLYYGKLIYPIDLLQLLELREEIVVELACNDLPNVIKPELKKLLADRMITII